MRFTDSHHQELLYKATGTIWHHNTIQSAHVSSSNAKKFSSAPQTTHLEKGGHAEPKRCKPRTSLQEATHCTPCPSDPPDRDKLARTLRHRKHSSILAHWKPSANSCAPAAPTTRDTSQSLPATEQGTLSAQSHSQHSVLGQRARSVAGCGVDRSGRATKNPTITALGALPGHVASVPGAAQAKSNVPIRRFRHHEPGPAYAHAHRTWVPPPRFCREPTAHFRPSPAVKHLPKR